MPCRIKDNFPNNHIKPDKMATVSSWYRKNMVPTIPSLEKICTAFGITLSLMFAEEDKGEIAMKIKYFVLGAVSVGLVGALTFGAHQMGLHANSVETEASAVSAQPSAEAEIPEEAGPLVVLPVEEPEENPEVPQAEEPVPAPEPVPEPEEPASEPETQVTTDPQPETPEPEPVSEAPAPAPAQTVSTPVVPATPQKLAAPLNEGTTFEGHAVTVNDWTTPAVFSGGKDWPITVWYFYDEDGRELGKISGESAMKITQRYSSSNIEWEFWFAEAFNEFREVNTDNKVVSSDEQQITEHYENYRSSDFDAEEYAIEAFKLINDAREDNGLHTVEMDDYAMELALMRVEELEENYSHTRPDGSRMSQEYGCGEIINRRANSPKVAVTSWLDSQSHYDIIMADRYHSAGIACFEGEDGVVYWCMLFFR